MPFTENELMTTQETRKGLVRVYVDPDEDSADAFARALDDAIERARWTAVSEVSLYSDGLPSHISFNVVHVIDDKGAALPAAHEDALRSAGLQSETVGHWSIQFSLSWNIDPRYRVLQEELEARVDLRNPIAKHNEQITVAAYNATVMKQVMQEAFGLDLDGSFTSVKELDKLLTMDESEETWQFRVFSAATSIACGDYAAEIATRTLPGVKWGDDEKQPLIVGGTATVPGGKTSTRNKARKRCVYGPQDSISGLIHVLLYLMREGGL